MDCRAGGRLLGSACEFFASLTADLAARVRHWIQYDTPDENGVSYRDHMKQARVPVEDPALPLAGEHLWDWFLELDAGRSSGFGLNPLSYSEIAAWAALSGAQPSSWEVTALKRMDAARLSAKPLNGGKNG